MARVVGPADVCFDQLVMSGGGLRCLWQGGFLEVVCEPLKLIPKRVIGVSGGALSATSFLAHCGRDVLDRFIDLAKDTPSNAAWQSGSQKGLTPHQSAYRQVVTDCLTQRQDMIAQGSPFQVYLVQPLATAFPKLTGTLSALLYQSELHTKASPHFSWPAKLGVSGFRVDARAAAQSGNLVDLVCAAAVLSHRFSSRTCGMDSR